MCCYICNTALYLTSDQKFELFKEKVAKRKFELLYDYYRSYMNLFAKTWNEIYEEKQMGSK